MSFDWGAKTRYTNVLRKSWNDSGKFHVQEFYHNGQLRAQKSYRDDKLDGKCRSWHENGQLERQEFYQDGNLEGERKLWHKNGRVRLKEFYRNRNLEGERQIFFEDGSRLARHFYVDDHLVDAGFDRLINRVFSELKRKTLSLSLFPIGIFLISDLQKMIMK